MSDDGADHRLGIKINGRRRRGIVRVAGGVRNGTGLEPNRDQSRTCDPGHRNQVPVALSRQRDGIRKPARGATGVTSRRGK